MGNDALLGNKIAAAVLTAGLLAMVTSQLSEILYHEETPETQAFVIAEPDAEVATTEVAAEPAGPGDILPLLANADMALGEKVAKKCAACHSFDDGGPTKVGPNLYNVVNEPQGSRDFSYSDALKGLGGTWDYDALNHFLYDPKGYAPGTKMSFKGVRKDEERAALVFYLRSLSGSPAPLP